MTIDDLYALPKQSQLLLAHFLQRDATELMLLNRDRDVDSLLSRGWLTSSTGTTIGITDFKFTRQFWRQLKSLRQLYLTEKLLRELEFYRVRKSGMYPWVW